MRRDRLLREDESGSAPIEFVFAALFCLFLLFAVFEVAFALYGRNVVVSSAHEAARAVVELGATSADGHAVARSTVERAASGVVSDYTVDVGRVTADDRTVIRVAVSARLDSPGPIPITIPVDVMATASREVLP